MKILILNTPSKQKHLRSNYCSNVSKGRYYYPAIDLLAQSSILSKEFDVSVLDAIAENKDAQFTLDYIDKNNFDGVYALTGSSSRKDDLKFFKSLKEKFPQLKLLITGGYLLSEYENILSQNSSIDGILFDWASNESIKFFKNEGPFSYIATLKHQKSPDFSTSMEYPVPRHDLFPLDVYHHPNARNHPFSACTHSTGCPYTCDYCIYSKVPYRERSKDAVIAEFAFLKSIGVKEVFFQDPTFAAKRQPTIDLLKGIIEEKFNIGWFCQTRTDHMDKGILSMMKKAGCHAIMFGIESFNEKMLRNHKRNTSHEKTAQVYKICSKLGIQTLSYLVIGLPGDSAESIEKTVEFVKAIGSDYASFNLAVPVIGTDFRETAIKEGLMKNSLVEFDNSSEYPVLPTQHLSLEELSTIHSEAVKSFYFRPTYMLKRMLALRSLYEAKNQIREGLSLVKRILKL